MEQFSGQRLATAAGTFYPDDPARLRETLASCLAAPAVAPDGRLRALLVPHAGYAYSGAVAGAAFARLARQPDVRRALVLAPAHRVGFRGASVGSWSQFLTPLGAVPVDTEACAALIEAEPLVSARRDAHAAEHALEVQLPFLQTVLPDAALVPLVCGDLDPEELCRLAEVLHARFWQPDTVWIVSSDFTHFGAAFDYVPFTRDVECRLDELDRGAIRCIQELDADGFLQYVDRTGATICGALPIALFLAAVSGERHDLRAELVDYTTSGKLTGDVHHSVSYASLVFAGAAPPGGASTDGADGGDTALNEADRSRLLQQARQAIASRFAPDPGVPPPDPEPSAPARAAVVSLYLEGRLRGAGGPTSATDSLEAGVRRAARDAAFHDARFPAVTAAEVPRLRVEISVLGAPHEIAAATEFEIGRHGIRLEKGRHQALYLPQVPAAEGWDREATLARLALRAGLPQNGWRRGAKLSVFEAETFAEPEPA